jgi:hypothetical protein
MVERLILQKDLFESISSTFPRFKETTRLFPIPVPEWYNWNQHCNRGSHPDQS